jgi:hypothetical protein
LERNDEQAFALRLETACLSFKTALGLLGRQLRIVNERNEENIRAKADATMALVQSFVFNTRRARRMCEQGALLPHVPRDERKRFMHATKVLVHVRDVNEHGFDAKQPATRPKLHDHDDVYVDEMSLALASPDRILMGPLNLLKVYTSVERMRQWVGFEPLRTALVAARVLLLAIIRKRANLTDGALSPRDLRGDLHRLG